MNDTPKSVLQVAFWLCLALSLVTVTAIIWGFVTGEHVGLQVYAVLLLTTMGAVMWRVMLIDQAKVKPRELAPKESEAFREAVE